MNPKKILLPAIAVVVLVLAACGGSGESNYNGAVAGATAADPPAIEYAVFYTPIDPTPEPATQAVADEWRHRFQRVVFYADHNAMLVNNQWEFVGGGVAPFVQDGQLFVPVDSAIMAMGDETAWEIDGTEITAARRGQEISVEGIELDGVVFVGINELAYGIGLHSVGWYECGGIMVVTTGSAVPRSNVMYRDINNQTEAWYGNQNSIDIAIAFAYIQRADGGWPRGIGQGGGGPFAAADIASIPLGILQAGANSTAHDAYFGRGITTNETRFMLRMYEATRIPRIGESAMRGLNAILDSQFTEGEGRGGWPYYVSNRTAHRGGVSINDDSYTTILVLLQDIKNGMFPNVIDDALRTHAAQAFYDGVQCLLRIQVRSSGFADGIERPTAWAQHADPVTGLPMWARDHEPASIAGWESLGIIELLMSIENPCDGVIRAVSYAVFWYDYAVAEGWILQEVNGNRTVVESPGARNLWGRFHCAECLQPTFVRENNLPNRLYVPPNPVAICSVHGGEGNVEMWCGIERFNVDEAPALRNYYQFAGSWAGRLRNQYQAWLFDNELD